MIKKCMTCGKEFNSPYLNPNRRKCCSIVCGNKFKKITYQGDNNPFYGKKHSENTKIKMKKARKIFFENGGKSPSWKGGKRIGSDGYVLIYSSNHPFRNFHNYVREHRLIMEKYIKRFLKKEESVHHIDEIKINNTIENLIAFTSESAHQKFHKDPLNVKPEEIIFDGRNFSSHK